jgi:hypothetical protein
MALWHIEKAVSCFAVLAMVCLAFEPAVAGNAFERDGGAPSGRGPVRNEVPGAFRDMATLAAALIDDSTDTTDTDDDGLFDSVERALGTSPNFSDSDYDSLPDYSEVFNGSDPNNPDSNGDHMPDLFEITNVSRDLDSDGVPNVWDWDNDGDGVMDSLDISPFARTSLSDRFQLNFSVSGEPTYLTFQVSPSNPAHLRLFGQMWDWPYDITGTVKDLDNSTQDVYLSPLLEYRSVGLPDRSEMAKVGISVADDAAYISLFPVYEFGNIVAFKGRMYYPEAAGPRDVMASLNLVWKVIGKTDNYAKALKADSRYLTAGAGGNITAGPTAAGANETFDWIIAGAGYVSLRAEGGRFLSVAAGDRVAATSLQPGEDEVFQPVDGAAGQIYLKANNGRYLTVKADGSVHADAEAVTGATAFGKEDRGVRSTALQLASYNESFTLSGFSIEEDFGSKAGVFYSGSWEGILAANMVLASDYLRNASYELGDMPARLKNGFGLNISSNISSFDQNELAMCALIGDMPRDAVRALPDGTFLPIVAAVEDRGRRLDLSDVAAGSYIKGSSLRLDSTAAEVLTTRTLKATWYDTAQDEPLELSEAVAGIRQWNLTDAAKIAIIALTIKWGSGEQKVIRINATGVDYHEEFGNTNINTLIIDVIQGGADAYGEIKDILELGWGAFSFTQPAKLASTLDRAASTVDGLADAAKAVNKVKSGTKGMETGTKIEIIGFVIDVLLAAYAIYVIGDALGWGPVGTGIAVSYGVLLILFSAVLTAMGGGPLGALIATLIGLSDLIVQLICGTSWTEMLLQQVVQWFIDWFSTMRIRCEVGLDVINTTSSVKDVDQNGLDVGDNISYTGHFFGNVTRTSDGNGDDLTEGYIEPQFTVAVPENSNSRASSYRWVEGSNQTGDRKSTVYETGISVEPGIGMVNFPVAVGLGTNYRVFYDECWWALGWQCERNSQTCSTYTDWTVMCFDVMPGSIDDFAAWRGMNSSDWDGDGLNNTAENGTSMWNWDTDGDGLGDQYELETGTDPARWDMDGDSLSDSFEIKQGSNASSKDTDLDGLDDNIEHAGQIISFQYCGRTFHARVGSDPRVNDTDGDGPGG